MGRRFDLVAYLKLFRFPLVFTAIADSAAGYLLVQRRGVDPGTAGLLAVASAGLYFLGMALNDVADRERDKVIAPNRVMPSGRVSLRGALGACVIAVLLSGTAVALAPGRDPGRFVAWGATILCILAYDFLLKVPPVMGLVRGGNFLLGVFFVAPPIAPFGPTHLLLSDYGRMTALAIVPVLYGTALTFISTMEEGDVRRRVVVLGAAFMGVAALLPGLLHAYVRGAFWGFVPAGALIAWISCRAARAVDRKGVMLLVRDGVAGFILLDATWLAAAGRLVPAAAIAGLLIPAALSVAWFKKLA